ncbi:AraC family transcriptional regulator [Hymenobacter sp. GOD-10R]|uniref:helix-turn-helix domain-containing protein n=1 Tax=Hymenobacter sp. GOD-10R TaxID=3093922 RepID=UPI002D77F159|nr:AraC family transcriptional regulator [Hymenobacter sp. GOD-10R]WRQ30690.1 AraC family transcriptional regulator [Hymenobacter sp. GOD-10R]
MLPLPLDYLSRQAEILTRFEQVLEQHLDDLLAGRVEKMHELQDFAAALCLHPGHLSQVIKLASGQHACQFYQQKIVRVTKNLLTNSDLSIGDIAHRLDYDVSNFTKFFKRFTGFTPSAYRKAHGSSPISSH